MERRTFAAGAVLGLLAVALGAFGAHALEGRVDARALAVWNTAAKYHAWHALALVATALAHARWPGRALRVGAVCFVVGILLFCGSLYSLSLGAPRAAGMITPFGGLSFMIGWAALAVAPFRSASS